MEKQIFRNSPELEPAMTHAHYTESEELSEELKVDEIGLTSAPLKSVAFQMHNYCKDYCDDFMKCRDDNGIESCLPEGRKVTRCGQEFIRKMQKTCHSVFKEHYTCLVNNNQQLESCRTPELELNSCISSSMNIKKEIPNAVYQVHLKPNPIYQ